jgi:hypothetical protein
MTADDAVKYVQDYAAANRLPLGLLGHVVFFRHDTHVFADGDVWLVSYEIPVELRTDSIEPNSYIFIVDEAKCTVWQLSLL